MVVLVESVAMAVEGRVEMELATHMIAVVAAVEADRKFRVQMGLLLPVVVEGDLVVGVLEEQEEEFLVLLAFMELHMLVRFAMVTVLVDLLEMAVRLELADLEVLVVAMR